MLSPVKRIEKKVRRLGTCGKYAEREIVFPCSVRYNATEKVDAFKAFGLNSIVWKTRNKYYEKKDIMK